MLEPANYRTFVTPAGERLVVLPEAEFLRLTGEAAEPPLPPPNARGNYPALETMRALMARDLVRSRRALGWSQAELARRAGVRAETLNRIEQGRHSASVSTIEKLDGALKAGETAAGRAAQPAGRGAGKRKRK
ncbi:MAG TPA: helix-turn-helix transcriptional regulator [Pirellulales bacterium]|nr:helix-turn-helix transcriptional regulator [Pirellulales bacterium]